MGINYSQCLSQSSTILDALYLLGSLYYIVNIPVNLQLTCKRG